jgi:hypothetical protein
MMSEGGYQSSAIDEAQKHPEHVPVVHSYDYHEQDHPQDNNYTVPEHDSFRNDNLIPSQTISLKEALMPQLNRFVGIGIANFFYYVAYLLCILSLIGFIFNTTSEGFRWHWSAGVLALIFSLLFGVLGFFFGVFLIRLVLELIISVFIIREKLIILATQNKSH